MPKFIYNIEKLFPGDIILTRNQNDPTSQRVMSSTNSEFSHAMLYMGNSSYINAENKVEARNLSRCLFDNIEDTCVLRIKPEYLTSITIDAALYYVRCVVGNPYALFDAIRMEQGRFDKSTENTQICTRLVAKAYAYSGLNIVENVEMCTPQQLLESEFFNVYRGFLREANDFDNRFADSHDVTDDMVEATKKLLDSVKSYDGGKISSLHDLLQYVLDHPNDDQEMSKLLKNSGYLNVLDKDEEFNVYNYDKDEFIRFYGVNAYEAAIQSLEINLCEKQRYEQECLGMIKTYLGNVYRSHYLILLIELYIRIISQHDNRIRVCYEVMKILET